MFRTTGIIRRIDASGRVSIPRELRKKYRLVEESPVEIGENENNLVLRKYSPIAEFTATAKSILESFTAVTGLPAILCDTDVIVTAHRTAYISGKKISDELSENIINKSDVLQNIHILQGNDIVSADGEIIYSSDRNAIGAVIIPDSEKTITESQKQCLKLCAKAIGCLMI